MSTRLPREFARPLSVSGMPIALTWLALLAAESGLGALPSAHAQVSAPASASPTPSQNPGPGPVADASISGRVVDRLTGEGMLEVQVAIPGTALQTTSDVHGNFTLAVPAGEHELEFSFELYKKQSLRARVTSGQRLHLKKPVVLSPEAEAAELDVQVIREPDRNSSEAQNQVRKNSARVSDIVSAEEIRKSADTSAAQVAARVVGATIVGERFVYVRGLGERYANTLFNGAPLPSPEPDQQSVPFDIFPASLLANLTIVKSATPDIPGDFAGGSVQINTRDFPGRLTINLSASLGANVQTALQPMLSYRGGSLDWLGFDVGTRARPPADASLSPSEYGRRFTNIWSPTRLDTAPPNFSLAGSVGSNATIGGKKLGYLVSLSYGADSQTREEEVRVLNLVDGGSGKELRPLVSFGGGEGSFARGDGPYSVRSTRSVHWGSLATVSLQPAAGHRLSLTGVFTQSADRESRIYQGFSQEQFAQMWNSRLRFIARSFGFGQLGGNHHVEHARAGASEIDWSVTYAAAARAEPDNREVTYIKKDDGRFHFTPKGTSGQRFFSDNTEHQLAALVDVTQGFKQWRGIPAFLKLGAAARYRLRDFSAHRYKFGFGGLGSVDDTLPPEQIFAAQNLGSELDVRENTNTADTYHATMGVYAAYAMVDLPLAARLRLTGGLRFEAALQRLATRDPRSGDEPIEIALDTYDPLPSLNLTYRVRDDMNLRAGASMTVARPEFRELAPFQFADFFGGELVQGNPKLQRTRIVNADLRWEWFTGPVDLLAVSLFYKYFDQPIETTINAGGDLIRSFANARAAKNLGAELEARKDLAVLGQGARGLAVGGNLSLVYSRVDLNGVEGQQTSKERALQGQAPVVVNVFLELDRPDWGTQARLLYNVLGERIDQVGAFGLPDKFEQPRHQLDFSISQRLPGDLSLRLSARNLLNSPVHIIQRGSVDSGGVTQQVAETTLRYRTGQVVMLTLGYAR